MNIDATYSEGWTCSNCGEFVSWSKTHWCRSMIKVSGTSQSENIDKLDLILAELEIIRKLLEVPRICYGCPICSRKDDE